MTLLEKIYYTTQITSFVIIAFTAVHAKKQYQEQLLHSRIAKAAELAKHFKENQIPLLAHILILFKVKELKPILEKINLDEIKYFNANELGAIIEPKELDLFKAALTLDVSQILQNKNTGEKKERLSGIMVDCLNDLEYFCINFNSKIADTDTVYQSLHQALFSAIPIIYIYISSINASGTDKYYTNIIAVYNTWRKKYNLQLEKERKLYQQQKKYANHCQEATVISPPQIK